MTLLRYKDIQNSQNGFIEIEKQSFL